MSEVRTIAVGYDGSADADAAARWALDLALRLGADVVLVHAVGLLERYEHADASRLVKGAAEALASEARLGPERVRWQVKDGDALSVLLRCADAPLRADLLVVGSRGTGKHFGLMLGSTSLEVTERSRIPVAIVPSGR